jgi:hypothetical protein
VRLFPQIAAQKEKEGCKEEPPGMFPSNAVKRAIVDNSSSNSWAFSVYSNFWSAYPSSNQIAKGRLEECGRGAASAALEIAIDQLIKHEV